MRVTEARKVITERDIFEGRDREEGKRANYFFVNCEFGFDSEENVRIPIQQTALSLSHTPVGAPHLGPFCTVLAFTL